jgi:hypothetical protein
LSRRRDRDRESHAKDYCIHLQVGRAGKPRRALGWGNRASSSVAPQAFYHNRPNHSPDSMRRSHGINSRPRGSGMPGDTFTSNSSSHPNTTSKMLRQADGHDTVQRILGAADVPPSADKEPSGELTSDSR